jgi:uncharacterized membrane protein
MFVELRTRARTTRLRRGIELRSDRLAQLGGIAMDKRVIGIVLLIVGAALLYFGLQATDAPLEQVRESVTGDYSDQTMLYLIGGAAAAVGGIALLLVGGKR